MDYIVKAYKDWKLHSQFQEIVPDMDDTEFMFNEKQSIRDSSRTLKRYGSTCCNSLRNNETLIRHIVEKTDTLQGIALKYGCTTEQIRRANRLFASDSLFLRQFLLVPVEKNSPYYPQMMHGHSGCSGKQSKSLDSVAAMTPEEENRKCMNDFLNKIDNTISESRKYVERSKDLVSSQSDADICISASADIFPQRRHPLNNSYKTNNNDRPPQFQRHSSTGSGNSSDTAHLLNTTQTRRVQNSLKRLEKQQDDFFEKYTKMSDKDLDAIILVTQQVVGKYVKKPPLTEKLLKKPPFRFLMDVFNNFIKQTGKFDGLYTPEEQLFENIGSREDKIRFLQKMIDATKLITKRDLKVRTSKIVAGQEPELTNELLQAMASVAEKNLEWDSAVDQVNPSPAGKEEDPKRRKEKRISPQEQKLRKATEPASRSSPSEKDKASQKKSKVPKDDTKLSRQSSKQKSPSPVKLMSKAKIQISPSKTKEPLVQPVQESTPAPLAPPAEPESRKSSSRSRRSSGSHHRQPEPNPNESQSQPAVQPSEAVSPAESSINNSDVKRETPISRENSKESNPRPRTSLRPPSARPASARPGAPRRRNVEIVLQPNDQIKMSGINVKLETFGDLDDDGENLVIIEDANSHDIVEGKGAEEPALEGQLDAQGRLVQQILETQKELVHQNAEVEPLQSQAARQSSARQVNDLRDVIQRVTNSVNPLGKLLDFIPEDIDAMQLELTMWRDTHNQASMELKREQSLTASATEPMKHQLQQIEASIAEYRELVDESRQRILQNNARILKLMSEQ
ncbi:hypothetical protein M5D96_000105 [Drosophila gunungcola]|uniref:TRAF3-interacting protein 1 n=1 Tax=Drosophila gunungcola TaxID=103775 RepID=A0A9Q0BTF2_9MUSC|nr:hypothetical protein M5D96_000105 [Drosophila gunungcola]